MASRRSSKNGGRDSFLLLILLVHLQGIQDHQLLIQTVRDERLEVLRLEIETIDETRIWQFNLIDYLNPVFQCFFVCYAMLSDGYFQILRLLLASLSDVQ